MKNLKIILLLLLFPIVFISCDTVETTDKEKPRIDLDFQGAFPVSCDTLYFGESFKLKLMFYDNVELGSYSIDIHHNFDHHSHSTEVTQCNLDPIKEPVNPFVFIEDYNIPSGLNQFETNLLISIPSGNNSNLYDEGDYHFFVSLTDKEGWSTQKGLSIKILRR